MTLSGHQPNYLPYPGLIGKILHSDKFIYVSNVQLEKKSWQNRNRIKGANGEIILSVPVQTKGKFEQKISETLIDNKSDWRSKHFSSIRLSYKKSRYYETYIDFFEDLYKRDWEKIDDLDIYVTNWILSELKINTEICYDKSYDFLGKNNDLLIEMTKKLRCDTYLSNKGSENYVDIDLFVDSGLNHKYMNYVGKKYRQQFGEFIPYLSIVDMMFNIGPYDTFDILSDDNNYEFSEINKRIE